MTISSLKYHCCLRRNGIFVTTYDNFTDSIIQDVFETIGDEPAEFPFRFVFVPIMDWEDMSVQLFVCRHINRYKVWVRQNFIILRKRKQKLSNTLQRMDNLRFEINNRQ